MNITIIAVGKIKEDFLKKACAEYEKRLSRFCKMNIIEIPDEPMSDNPKNAERDSILKKEGAKISAALKDSSMLISLCVEGKQMTSENFAEYIDNACLSGTSHFTFIIGGSLGLLDEIKSKSDLKLSFSEMTFPHQLMRVILLEQIFRAFKINHNENYHK